MRMASKGQISVPAEVPAKVRASAPHRGASGFFLVRKSIRGRFAPNSHPSSIIVPNEVS